MYQQVGMKCPACGDVIYSNSQHDFEECLCGALYIDGGYEYTRVGWDGDTRPGAIERVSRMVDRKAQERYYGDEPERRDQLIAASKGR